MGKQNSLRAIGGLVVLMPLSALAGHYFLDDFSSYTGNNPTNINATNDIGWDAAVGVPASRPDVCDTGTPPCLARPGDTKSLRFNFPAGPTSGSVQNINLGTSEVWLEWYQNFPGMATPPAWTHQGDPTLNQDNQYFLLHGNGIHVNAMLKLTVAPPLFEEEIELEAVVGGTIGNASGASFKATSLGTWQRVRWHARADAMHGIFNHWLDAPTPVLYNVDFTWATTATMFTQASLMGPSNSGYAVDSKAYIDDIFISHRPPVSIMLVLDKSGSMGGLASGNANSLTRIAALKKAAGAFLDTVPAHAGPRDRIGVVTFDTSATLASPLILATGGGLGAINTNVVDNLMSGGATAIGQALTIAKAQLLADSNPHKVILLFTDGVQNVSPMVEDAALPVDAEHGGFTIGGTEFGPDPHGAFHADGDVQVCVVSIGPATNATFNQKLSQCADAGYAPIAPFSRDFVCATDTDCEALMAGLFAELRGALYGDKLETGAITRNADRFLVNQEDVRVSIVLLWSDPAVSSRALRVTLRSPAPGSVDVEARPFTTDGNGYQVISFPLPLQHAGGSINDYAGEWGLTVSTTAAPAFQYTSMVMNDNRIIATSYLIEGSDFGAGDAIPIEVTVSQNGIPVRGASVISNVESPNDGVGNVLSTNRTPTGDVDTQGDTLSPAQQKLELLLKDPNILEKLQLVTNPDVVLTDADGDGVYRGTYRRTNVPGKYQFEFLVDGETPENGRFTRVLTQTVLVRVKPTAGNSALDVKLTDGQGFNSTVTFTPRDRLGNYLGPGYAHLITVSGKGSLVGMPVDNLDGSYVLNVALASPSTRPDIGIGVDGVTVDVRRRPWWLWLLLLLIPLLD